MFKDNYSVRTHLTKLFMQRYERYLPTAFDESMSILEKMNKLIEAQNSLIDVVNSHTEFTSEQLERAFGIIDENLAKQLKQFRDELEEQKIQYEEIRDAIHSDLLPNSVKQKLEEWLLNGTIEELINDVVFSDITERLDIVENRQLEYDKQDRVIYVNGDTGSNSGFGEQDSPFKSMTSAFNLLKNLSDKGAEGKWTIKVSGTINEGYRILELPYLREPLDIVGDVSSSGEPVTVFDGSGANRTMGLWFEPSDTLRVNVYNIVFKNWGDESTIGYGVLMKDKGHLHVENCDFVDNYIGIGSVNHNRCGVHGCKFIRNQTGVMSQYNGTLTVGSTALTDERENLFKDNGYGVRVTRNSVAHVDYNVIKSSTLAGVSIDMTARANVYGNVFEDNKLGVSTAGSSEWISNNNTFVNNVLDFQHFGSSRETRTHSSRTNIYYDYLPVQPPSETLVMDSLSASGKTLMTLPSIYALDKQQIEGLGKRWKIRVVGSVRNPVGATGRLVIRTVDTNTGGSPDDFGYMAFDDKMLNQSFEYVFESVNIEDHKQATSNKVDFGGNRESAYLRGMWTKQFDGKRSIRIVGVTNIEGVEVEIRYVQLSVAG